MNGKAQNKTKKDPFERPFNYAEYQNFNKIKKAQSGDTNATKEIFEQFTNLVRERTGRESLSTDSIKIPVSICGYFVMCFETIKEIFERCINVVRERTGRESLSTDSIEIPISYCGYFTVCFETILNQLKSGKDPDANKAFNLTTSEPGRRKDPETLKRNQDICSKIFDKVSKEKKILKEAIFEVASEINLSSHRVKKIWEKMNQRWLNDD